MHEPPTKTVCMPRRNTRLIVAAHRVAEARRIVASQQELIARLKALGQSTFDAERALQTYLSALKHLEDHERRVRTAVKKRETKKAAVKLGIQTARRRPLERPQKFAGAYQIQKLLLVFLEKGKCAVKVASDIAPLLPQ